jgi:4-hydroxybenzoate polyprenyltransferase
VSLHFYCIAGTILASITGVARALMENPTTISLHLVPRAMMGMLALLFGNAFIVGINQIYDVDIDKINKPFLPMAAGEVNTYMNICSYYQKLASFALCFEFILLSLCHNVTTSYYTG